MKYKEKIYMNLKISDLILFAIYSIKKNNEVCTFERLVAECFNNFPKSFCFKRYPQWPDSLKFDRSLRTLREKGLIIGGVGGNYSPGQMSLTSVGINIAKKIDNIFEQNEIIFNKKSPEKPRSIDEKLIQQLELNLIFKKFNNNPKTFTITDPEFRNLLKCTLETPERIVIQNFNYLYQLARLYKKVRIIEFLNYCNNTNLKKKNG
ncbi:MAG: hypothetical protein ACD_79C00601G0003 [uncultured bacterium]|nr:MAG: hypothetical protein ACD_79C00601G0003 [uncultured bacterium]